MLTGTISYTDGLKTYKYNVEAVDNSFALNCRITSLNYDDLLFLAGEGATDLDVLDVRRFAIGLTKVTIAVSSYSEKEGEIVKGKYNDNFFTSLGSFVRLAKTRCTVANSLGVVDARLASGEFLPETKVDYSVKDDNGVSFGTVQLTVGDITEMHIKNDNFTVDLSETNGYCEVFFKIKSKVERGIKFDTSHTGVYIAPQIVNTDSIGGLYSCIEDVVKAHPEKELEWLLGKDYQIVSDDNLQEVCDYIYNHDGFVYYDTETTGLKITFKSRIDQGDVLVGVVLSVKYGESFFFPCRMKSIKNLCNGDHVYFMEHYMRRILEGKELVAHNAPFDWKVAYIYDINANIVQDTLALIKLTMGAEKGDLEVNLKSLAKLLLHRDSLSLSDLVIDNSWGEDETIKFWDLPYELVRLYACADTDNTMGILEFAIANDLLGAYNARKTYDIEMAFTLAVAYQEFYGHRFDVGKIDSLKEEITQNIEKYYQEMVGYVGHEFNPNSSPQLLNIMYKTEAEGGLGIPVQISRKSGRPTTDKETLKSLSEITDIDNNAVYPFVVALQKYRENEGIRKIIDQFPELATKDGYIFSDIQQYGTRTGRVSTKKPNYQGYNDPVKKNIIPRPGYYMSDSDYSSIEYRVLGSVSGNEKIKEGFVDPDFDYHSYQASRMYSIPYANITSKLRKAAKGINFGLPYGMGDESLGVRIFGTASNENTRKAAELRIKYFDGQQEILDFFEKARNMGVDKGYTETFFGRRRYYNKATTSRGAIRRQAGNQVIQGTAADIYKLAIGRLFKRICKEGWLGKVLLTGFIHDETLNEIHNSIDPAKWLSVLREEFQVVIEGWCPLYMGFGFGMSWYEAKKTEWSVKLQSEWIDKYAETGYPKWTGDGRALCDEIPEIIAEFTARDIENQIQETNSQNNTIKPALNNELFNVLFGDNSMTSSYSKILSQEKYSNGAVDEEELLDELNKVYITSIPKDSNGNIIRSFPKTKDTQVALDYYCLLRGINRANVNLLSIEEIKPEENTTKVRILMDDAEDYSLSVEDERILIDKRVDTLGLYLNTETKEINLLLPDKEYLDYIFNHSNDKVEGYNIRFKDNINKRWLTTKRYIKSEDIRAIQEMYILYLNSKIGA